MKTFLVKEKRAYMALVADLAKTTKAMLAKQHITYKELQFAKAHKDGGYTFLAKEVDWAFLEKIAQKAHARHKTYRLGEIVDVLAELINTTIADELQKREIVLVKEIEQKEKEYLQKQLIEADEMAFVIIMPHLKLVKQVSEGVWQAKDLTSGEIVTVGEEVRGDFVQYSC